MKLVALAALLALVGNGTSVPVSEQKQPQLQKTQQNPRQDVDEEGISEIENVGEQVGQIISGVFSGNLGQIFGGSTGFIEDADTQNGVGTILTSVNRPLGTLLSHWVQQQQKYYNITQPTTSTARPPTPAVQQIQIIPQVVGNQPNHQPIVVQSPIQQQQTKPAATGVVPIIVQVPAAAAAVPEPGVSTKTDEEEESESEDSNTLKLKL